MKKRDLLSLYNALTMVEGRQFSVKFSYFIAKNKVLLKNEITALEEARKPDPKFVEFDTKRATMAHDMADKDEKGQAKVENNNFIIIEKVNEFKKALDELKEKNSKVIKDQEQSIKDFEDILDEDVEYKGPKIDFKDIPTGIEAVILEALIVADLIIEEQQE
jgi:seryl-tRNA synthetase